MAGNSSVPELYFDGQFIDVLWDDYDNAINWFEKYFGWSVSRREDWKVDPACVEGAMTQMNYGTWLVTYLTESRLPHHYADRGTAEAHVRLCFRVRDLEKRHDVFTADGVRVSPIYDGPKARLLRRLGDAGRNPLDVTGGSNPARFWRVSFMDPDRRP